VVFSNGDEPFAASIDPEVRESPAPVGRCDRRRLRSVGTEPIQASVDEMGEDDDSAVGHVRAATVFMDAGADVERRWRELDGVAVRRSSHEHPSATFGRPAFDPVGVGSVEPRLGEGDGLAGDKLGGDRRSPGTKRRDGRHRGTSV
jgi:hypothetical protein